MVFGSTDGLWTIDVRRGTASRVTTRGAFPVWLDSTRIAYWARTEVVIERVGAQGTAETLKGTTARDYPASVSPDGSTLALVRVSAETRGDVFLVPTDGSEPPRPYLATPDAYEGGAQFSPDGRWFAFTSDESGRQEVYLTSYPAPDRRWQVSVDGGLHPLWSSDGAHIFYRSGEKVLTVDVTLGDEPVLSQPRLLFERQYRFGQGISIPNYSLSDDGQGLLMVKEEAGGRSLSFVANWLASLDEARD